MKKLILCLSLISLSFLSCNSDDDSGKTDNNNIVGTWNLTSLIVDNEDISTSCSMEEFYEINADNTFSLQLFDVTSTLNQDGTTTEECIEVELVEGTYTIENNSISFLFDAEDEPDVAMFTLNNDNLVLTFGENDIETYVRGE